MSLNWSIQNVENFQELVEDPFEQEVTKAVTFMTMAVGINRIDEKTVEEFILRSTAIEQFGPFLAGPRKEDGTRDEGISADMIRRRIGLRTNANSLTRAQFVKKLGEQALDRGKNVLYQQELAKKKAAREAEAASA